MLPSTLPFLLRLVSQGLREFADRWETIPVSGPAQTRITSIHEKRGSRPEYLTVAQAADFAQVSPATVYRALRRGDLQCLRVNDRQWRMRRQWVDEWLSRTADAPMSKEVCR